MPQHAGIRWTTPGGGLYIWLTLPPRLSAGRRSELFEACLNRGVLYVPGEYAFLPDASGHCPMNHLRLSFGHVPLSRIEPAIRRLASAIVQVDGLLQAR
jgi:DNA-binding transcriptional MocR family regulator